MATYAEVQQAVKLICEYLDSGATDSPHEPSYWYEEDEIADYGGPSYNEAKIETTAREIARGILANRADGHGGCRLCGG